jgi:tRNA dimethylallyltransferase
MEQQNIKLVVILGPTASGKTKLAVELARRFDGEIVSADSRQVYRGMDVGTGKDLVEYGEIKHHLIDVVDPMEEFSLAQYKKMADTAIEDIARRGKVPFLVGGSGMYLQAVVDNYDLVEVGADKGLRTELEALGAEALFAELEKLNPAFAAKVNASDRKNKRRLVRYIELQSSGPKPETLRRKPKKYDCLLLGLNPGKDVIEGSIYKRLVTRLENEDMVAEIDGLHGRGVTWQRLRDFGLEYRFISEYLQERIDYDAMVERLNIATRQFAKKQMTWFKRWEKQGARIGWLVPERKVEEAQVKVKEFLN